MYSHDAGPALLSAQASLWNTGSRYYHASLQMGVFKFFSLTILRTRLLNTLISHSVSSSKSKSRVRPAVSAENTIETSKSIQTTRR